MRITGTVHASTSREVVFDCAQFTSQDSVGLSLYLDASWSFVVEPGSSLRLVLHAKDVHSSLVADSTLSQSDDDPRVFSGRLDLSNVEFIVPDATDADGDPRPAAPGDIVDLVATVYLVGPRGDGTCVAVSPARVVYTPALGG